MRYTQTKLCLWPHWICVRQGCKRVKSRLRVDGEGSRDEAAPLRFERVKSRLRVDCEGSRDEVPPPRFEGIDRLLRYKVCKKGEVPAWQ
jgi:hypothetical protein